MSSDSEDDEQLKQFLEAADTTLLNNEMFQEKFDAKTKDVEKSLVPSENQKELPKSQRYIEDEATTNGTDFNLPVTMQKHMAKKLSDILKQTYEFCDTTNDLINTRKCKTKNRVKLLKGDECYVNAYEDFEYETKGPEKKPNIKRRCVEMEKDMTTEDMCKSVAVDGTCILSANESKCWAKKKQRKDKIFEYKTASNGILHAKEEINEFTAVRRKNKWNENKIKDFKIK